MVPSGAVAERGVRLPPDVLAYSPLCCLQVVATLPVIIWELVTVNAEQHIVVWFIAGICVVIAVPLSIHDGRWRLACWLPATQVGVTVRWGVLRGCGSGGSHAALLRA